MLIERQKYNLNKLLQKYNFQHLRPPPQVFQIDVESQIFREVGNGQKKRHIFWKVQYTKQENQAIQKIRKELQEKNIFQTFTDQLILKHLYATKFDQSQTFQRLLKVQQFHNNSIITKLHQKTIDKLQSGCIYTYGHDKQMKPIIIVRADKFDLKLTVDENYNYVYYLMLVVLGYRMIPYHSEKYVTIMDFNDMEFSKIPFKYLYEMFSKMNIYYCGNSQRAFIYNSQGVKTLWEMVSRFMPQHAKKNIIFIQKGKQKEILEYIPDYELQKRYGGKLQNLKKFWPPQSANSQFDQINMTYLTQETDFYTVENNLSYFEDNSLCGGDTCNCEIY